MPDTLTKILEIVVHVQGEQKPHNSQYRSLMLAPHAIAARF